MVPQRRIEMTLGRQSLDTGACVHWFRIDGPVAELYDLGVVPGVVRPMALGFATNEILGLTTHDPLEADGASG